ncbi:Vip1 protein [Histoplasma capsulatum var. duboisii H88]|uniref:Vip1 protein n=2 Tax=Ajellomyces capsulatus TaxID=5037 RepID=A0A8A1LA19_AJEC8|nr:Vip1 protein [Histoplasma capsulatum H143]QSS50480.1 Vip1 protein [Histoplasma capsulatum var. duboisii H88]
MSSHTTVHVADISPKMSEKEVRDFFSFCGKITSLSITPSSGEQDAPQSATVTFEKEAAAKTALLLDNTQLGPSSVKVTAAASIDELAGPKAHAESPESKNDTAGIHDIEQEDKPRSRIIAEYLAHGYVISDHAIQQAISLDKKHGFSTRFRNALDNFNAKFHATDKAKDIDSSYGISDKAASGLRGLSSYFEKALGTPTGQKVRDFYLQSDKQVRDIHNEARRLADLKSGKAEEAEGVEGKEKAEASHDVHSEETEKRAT